VLGLLISLLVNRWAQAAGVVAPDRFIKLALVVVASPTIDLGAREPTLVEAFVVRPAVEG